MPSREDRLALDGFNDQLRSSPIWRDYMSGLGYDLSQPTPIRLNDRQQRELRRQLEQAGVPFQGLEIDRAGNLNQPEGFGTQFRRWAPMVGQALVAIGTGGMSLPAQFAINAGLGSAIGSARDGWRGAATGAATGAASVGVGQAFNALRGVGQGTANAVAPRAGDVLRSGRAISTDIAMRGVPGQVVNQNVSQAVRAIANGLQPLASRQIPNLINAVPSNIHSQGVSQFVNGGVLPSSGIPGPIHRATPPNMTNQNASHGVSGVGGDLPSSRVPGPLHRATPGPVTGSQGVSTALQQGGQSLLDRVLGRARQVAPLVPGAVSLINGVTGGRPPAEDRLNRILDLAESRARAQGPLFTAITNMAQRQLPTYAREGGPPPSTPPGTPPPTVPPPSTPPGTRVPPPRPPTPPRGPGGPGPNPNMTGIDEETLRRLLGMAS